MIYECHGHIILDSVAYASAVSRHQNGIDEAFIHNNFMICVKHGIRFYRDGGDKYGVSVFAKKIAGEYGVDYRTPAYIIHKKGHYGGMFGRAFESIREYRELIAEATLLGADFIKITTSGLLDFTNGGTVTGPTLTFEELSEMVNIAHGEGFAIMAHTNGPDNIKRAAEAGADSIEHGFYMDPPALRMMAQTGAVWVPTCAVVANLIDAGRADDDIYKRVFNSHKAALLEASAIGIPIACGSDAGAIGVPQGAGTLDELAVLESIGIDPTSGNRKIEEVFRRKC